MIKRFREEDSHALLHAQRTLQLREQIALGMKTAVEDVEELGLRTEDGGLEAMQRAEEVEYVARFSSRTAGAARGGGYSIVQRRRFLASELSASLLFGL